MLTLRILVILLISKVTFGQDDPLVEISQGTLKGTYLETIKGRKISAFMNIPFAEPPTGDLRFKASIPAKGWTGIRDASQDAPHCIQNNPFLRSREITGSEDCLYLNVYIPTKLFEQAVTLPVMVFFHGGGYMCGSGNKFFYPPNRLLDRDVVYVGVNYRLGVLGFLSTNDSAAYGNNGLKDQNLALKWIKHNIYHFGGDPGLVTIFGESAGGASVHFHMISPKSKGLFHRGISQSGTALCSWAESPPGFVEKNLKRLAEATNCLEDNNDKFVDCLRTKKAEDLVNVDEALYDWDYDPLLPFRPVVEPRHPDAFLSEDPRMILKEGRFYQVPWLLGTNAAEGAIRSANIFGFEKTRNELSKNFDQLAPMTFEYDNAENPEAITNAIKNFYLNGKTEMTADTVDGFTNIYTDAMFTNSIMDETLSLQFPKSKYPIYLYHFTHKGKNSFSEVFGDPSRNYGTCHADELMYLFHVGFFPEILNEKDARISDILVTFWTNFATSGNPNEPYTLPSVDLPEWESLTSLADMNYLEIGEKTKMGAHLLRERIAFWKQFKLWPKLHSKAYLQNSVHTEL